MSSREEDGRGAEGDKPCGGAVDGIRAKKEPAWGHAWDDDPKPGLAPAQGEKQKPTLELSGALLADTNTYKGVVIKYNEPPEAKKPRVRWRLYPFRGDHAMPVLYVHRQSAYLLGRDRRICDIAIDHPSASKQHAVLQYRLVPFTRSDGSAGRIVKPYVIDLNSANGTFLNGKRLDGSRYVELKERDVLKFGFSSREYVVLNEKSRDESDLEASSGEEETGTKTEVKIEEMQPMEQPDV